jgi:hypothetical protein
MSSLFVHVTVAPTGTVIVCGPKTKLSIFTSAFAVAGWSFAVTVGDPATSSTIAMINDAVKLATEKLFRFIISIPLRFDFRSWFTVRGPDLWQPTRALRHRPPELDFPEPKAPSLQVANRQPQGCVR